MTGDEGQSNVGAAADRREPRDQDLPPTAVIGTLPSLLVLNRLAVPVLAVDDDVIVFANTAFADMVGSPLELLHGSSIDDLCADPSAPDAKASSRFGRMVRLRHADGFIVRAVASRSILVRTEDTVALVSFTDVTEQLWETGSGTDGAGGHGAGMDGTQR